MNERSNNLDYGTNPGFNHWEEELAYSEAIANGLVLMAETAVEPAPEAAIEPADSPYHAVAAESAGPSADNPSDEEESTPTETKVLRKRKPGSRRKARVSAEPIPDHYHVEQETSEDEAVNDPEATSDPETEKQIHANQLAVYFRPDREGNVMTARLVNGPEGYRLNFHDIADVHTPWDRKVYIESIGDDGNVRRHMMFGNVVVDMDALEEKRLYAAAIDEKKGEKYPDIVIGSEWVIPDASGETEGYSFGKIQSYAILHKSYNKDEFYPDESKSPSDEGFDPNKHWIGLDVVSPDAEFAGIIIRNNIDGSLLAAKLDEYNGSLNTGEAGEDETDDNDDTPPTAEHPTLRPEASAEPDEADEDITDADVVEDDDPSDAEDPENEDDDEMSLFAHAGVALTSLRRQAAKRSQEAAFLPYRAFVATGAYLEKEKAKSKKLRIASRIGWTAAKIAYPYYVAASVLGSRPF